jgi:hypothetical protein
MSPYDLFERLLIISEVEHVQTLIFLKRVNLSQ